MNHSDAEPAVVTNNSRRSTFFQLDFEHSAAAQVVEKLSTKSSTSSEEIKATTSKSKESTHSIPNIRTTITIDTLLDSYSSSTRTSSCNSSKNDLDLGVGDGTFKPPESASKSGSSQHSSSSSSARSMSPKQSIAVGLNPSSDHVETLTSTVHESHCQEDRASTKSKLSEIEVESTISSASSVEMTEQHSQQKIKQDMKKPNLLRRILNFIKRKPTTHKYLEEELNEDGESQKENKLVDNNLIQLAATKLSKRKRLRNLFKRKIRK